jgi:hypothetical protein
VEVNFVEKMATYPGEVIRVMAGVTVLATASTKAAL